MPHYGPLILPESAQPLAQPLDTSLVLAGTAKPKKPKRKQLVLDEDTYVKTLDTIITRDYFPALNPLESLLSGRGPASGATSVRSSVRSSMNGSFEDETPDVRRPGSPGPLDMGKKEGEGEEQPEAAAETKLSLDQFTSNYTSEDNESFEQLIETEEKRREQKVFWVEEHAKQAAKHIINRLEEPKRTGLLDSWTYTVKNHLMFHPTGDEVTQFEPPVHLPAKEIIPENTRFPGGFFDKPTKVEEEKLKEAVPSTPVVDNFKLLRTPTPSVNPGEEFMTWGDIIGTPLHLKEEDLHEEARTSSSTKEFRVPATPARDEILYRLDAQSKERSKHLGARRTTTPGHRTPMTPMSPAARALLRSRTNQGDPQLRASYGLTPTPSPRPFARPAPKKPGKASSTPQLTPSPSPFR